MFAIPGHYRSICFLAARAVLSSNLFSRALACVQSLIVRSMTATYKISAGLCLDVSTKKKVAKALLLNKYTQILLSFLFSCQYGHLLEEYLFHIYKVFMGHELIWHTLVLK